MQRGKEPFFFFFFISFWAEVGASRLGENRFANIQTKLVQLSGFCFKKINTGFCKSKNKVSSLLYCSCIVKDQWRICNALRGNLVQIVLRNLEMK